ncbi:ComEC/Rec2 family competence protein [Tamlana sp. 2201CG12-4]|uniref:ComEC/Rec2 family competence protein n=1 Tax=Tamlana sp. 2201CG12-4 TaxID=3112582 RepID=UPI002DBFA8E1|nr:ComEC/Rec2 family competence protein [Tamlana sp. 2201CG12-4]MEC3907065.1 ComEC/Rec2 family competence protein [Tamlana sp. 2201CG12-4]
MNLLNFSIIKLTICLITGVFIGYIFAVPQQISLFVTGLLLMVLFISYWVAKKQFTKTIWFGLTALITMISIGVLTTSLHNQKNFSNHYTRQLSTPKDSLNTITFRVREILKQGHYYDKYIIDLLEVDDKSVVGKTLLNIQRDTLQPPLEVDKTFTCRTNFVDLTHPLNPNQFNYKNYLEKKYIYHQLFISGELLLPGKSTTITLMGVAYRIRKHINKKLESYNFKPDVLAIINALLLGQRQDISKRIYSNYTNAGAIHILAVSGLHVGIILMIFGVIFKPLEKFKHGTLIKTIALICLLWSFALIAGLSASVTRAVTMFSIVAIALNLKRPTNIYNTLAISMMVILLFNPLFLFDVGFQLSYLAVFSIVSIDPILFKLWQPKNKLLKLYWHTFTVTISAQLGIIPVSLFYFHQFPGLFFISNLVIIPLLGLILGFGILVLALAILNALPQFIASLFGHIISLMNSFIGWVSSQEAFLFKEIPFSLLFVFVSYLFLASLINFFRKRNFLNLRLFLIAILIVQIAFIYQKHTKPHDEFIIFHKNKFSLLGQVGVDTMIIYHDFDSLAKSNNHIIKDYVVGNHINKLKKDTLRSVYRLNHKTLLIVDSLGIYHIKSFQPDYILLRKSPKINLNRLIDSLNPKQIIADGSNYKSYIQNWKLICKKRKLPFHQTYEKGAFTIKY